MTKQYFETDKIQTVTLTFESETSYQWYEAVPETPQTFLGFRVGTHPSIKAGWASGFFGERRTTEEMRAYWDAWRVDETAMKVYNKAHVSIHLSYKHTVGCRFESNEEAQKYVDDLIASSDKKFNVIITK